MRWAGREALVQPLGGDIPRHPVEGRRSDDQAHDDR